jgi:hypothetical protein
VLRLASAQPVRIRERVEDSCNIAEFTDCPIRILYWNYTSNNSVTNSVNEITAQTVANSSPFFKIKGMIAGKTPADDFGGLNAPCDSST